MSLSTPKKALIGTALLVIITLALFSYYLKDVTLDLYLHGRPLLQDSGAGKLVARSQLDFHHVVEKWVPPEHQHTRLKERLIEDGRMIQEAIEYPEGENEIKRERFVEPDHRHSNLSLPQMGDKARQVFATPHTTTAADRNSEKVLRPQFKKKELERGEVESREESNQRNLTSLHLHFNESVGQRKSATEPQPPQNLQSDPKAAAKQSLLEQYYRLKRNTDTGIHSKHGYSNNSKLSDTKMLHAAEPVERQAVDGPPIDKESPQPGFVRVVSISSKGQRSVKYVKQQSHAIESKSEHSLDDEKKTAVKAEDLASDAKYAHLPLSVRKKIAALRRERQKRMEYTRLLREKCKGLKYCLHVRYKERHLHDSCFFQAIREEKHGVPLSPCTCKLFPIITTYANGRRAETNSTRSRVALVSLPGSGNTWVRGLLEQSTGYCTGSMWCDSTLRARQFCAEGLRSDTLVVKNHDPLIRWTKEKRPANTSELNKPMFGSAILVHRDPYEANVAEWNRALGFKVHNATKHNQTVAGIGYYNSSNLNDQHTIAFGKEAFGSNAGWNKTIYTQMENWEAMINHLLINSTGARPVLLVKYEDLKKDTIGEVKRMVNFLGEEMLPEAEQTLREGFRTFHRNHRYTFDHYMPEQKEYINSVIIRVAKQLELNNVDYLHVKKYLRDV